MSQDNKSSSLFTGIAVGTVIGAGFAYFFGTKKGKEIRKAIRNKYPELFKNVDEAVDDVKKSAPKLIKKLKQKSL